MTGFISYIADLLVYFAFAGISLHLADRYVGVPMYRWWYANSRDTPLQKEMGFLYGHERSRLHRTVLLISGVQSLTFLYKGKVDLLTEIPAFLLEAWFMMFGFWLGQYVYAWMRGEQRMVDFIHALHPSRATGKLLEQGKDLLARFYPKKASPSVPASQTPAAVEALPQPAEEKIDWRDQINTYTNRGGRQ